jgi:hypothetical protein
MPNSPYRAMRRLAVPALALAVLAVPGPADAARRGPSVQQMVVFKGGGAKVATVRATAAKVKVGGRRLTAPRATPLAALVRSRPGAIGLRSFSGQLYVRSIGSDRARGQSGWLYKVGNKLASAGAADPSGPFGSGRLRAGQKVTWYYASLQGQNGPRTLTLAVTAGTGSAIATVRSYDDEGRGRPEPGVTVQPVGSAGVTTSAAGTAVVPVAAGRRSFTATKPGLIRSFPVRATIR